MEHKTIDLTLKFNSIRARKRAEEFIRAFKEMALEFDIAVGMTADQVVGTITPNSASCNLSAWSTWQEQAPSEMQMKELAMVSVFNTDRTLKLSEARGKNLIIVVK